MPEQADSQNGTILYAMKVNIQIPADYDSITIGQFQELDAVWKKSEDPRWRAVQGVRILCNLEPSVAEGLTLRTLDKVYEKLDWLMGQSEHTHDLIPKMEFGGREYGFIPDFTKLQLGEFIDLETYAKQGFFDSLHQVMSILYRPIKEQLREHYIIEAYEPCESKTLAMKNAPMSVALGAMVFFLNIANRLSVDSISYLKEEEKGRH